MTDTITVDFVEQDLELIATATGAVVVFATEDGKLDLAARKANSVTRKAVERAVSGDAFEKQKAGDITVLAYPNNMAAEKLIIVKLPRRASVEESRKAGAAIAKAAGGKAVTVFAALQRFVAEIAFGLTMRTYDFDARKSGEKSAPEGAVFAVKDAATVAEVYADLAAVAEGVFFTRDLVNEPANVLTTTEFADRLIALSALGVEVEVLDEDKLAELGMNLLLSVGQGSASPSKVVVMKWNGGGDEAPFAFVGKGVVFDTGGISIKPAAGMEDMTMDMGGAGVVAGVMKTLALRKAKANVVGLVGLVENMPSGTATRPGDIVTSMKGDTVEIINTDAEGRLVLADVLWYAQETFAPVGMINLATLTGAILIALGDQNSGVFSNSDALSDALIKSAATEGEGAWRLPMSEAYDAQLKSDKADMKNIGGRLAGSITAAQFLQRFVKEGTPWAHIDIAGTASVPKETALAPKGATGWGVMALNRLIANHYEA